MRRAMATAALLLTLMLVWPAHAVVSGPAAVIDGDTIELRRPARSPAWHRRTRERPVLSRRWPALAVRRACDPRARRSDRWPNRRV